MGLIQSASGHTSGLVTTATATFGSNVVAGHTILVFVFWEKSSGSPNLSSITDSQGNTYSQDFIQQPSFSTVQWVCLGARATAGSSGALTVTATLTGNLHFGLYIMEF